MLRLPAFDLLEPTSLEEALHLLAEHGGDAMPIAGGTDLLPNMKHELFTPKVLVSLTSIPALRAIEDLGDAWRLGAGCPLGELANHPGLQQSLPALAEALGAVGGPHHRRMGTLGGNLCLDTRCLYYNQTFQWREALGFCLKKDGDVCHVAGGRKCVAAASNDSAPPLLVYDATVEIVGPGGARTLPVREFYHPDGISNTRLEDGELVVALRVAKPSQGTRAAFHKLRRSGAIDFPLLNMAVSLRLDERGTLVALSAAVSALAARPNLVKGLDRFLGQVPDEALVEAIANRCRRGSVPLTNLATDPEWRRAMVPVFIKRLLQRCLDA
ncbi:MAG: 4-hydroxybenzoyl-CoA reductase subunit beta [Myxococcales bacterium]|nr:4-hydroxybenzoyl-CoA reductase subunit beta [Myxococcales bacterium]